MLLGRNIEYVNGPSIHNHIDTLQSYLDEYGPYRCVTTSSYSLLRRATSSYLRLLSFTGFVWFCAGSTWGSPWRLWCWWFCCASRWAWRAAATANGRPIPTTTSSAPKPPAPPVSWRQYSSFFLFSITIISYPVSFPFQPFQPVLPYWGFGTLFTTYYFYWALLSFTRFYWVLLGFIGFYLVLLGLTRLN